MDEIAKFSRLVLMIEEAAVAPERWDPVVASIVEEIGATEGILFSPFLPPSLGGFWASRSIRPGHMEDYAAYYSDKDIWILAMKPEQLGTPGFVFRDDALIGHDTVRRSEFYNDFLRKLDIGRLLCGVVRSQGSAVPTGNIHLSVFRPMGKGGFSEHQQLLFQRLVPPPPGGAQDPLPASCRRKSGRTGPCVAECPGLAGNAGESRGEGAVRERSGTGDVCRRRRIDDEQGNAGGHCGAGHRGAAAHSSRSSLNAGEGRRAPMDLCRFSEVPGNGPMYVLGIRCRSTWWGIARRANESPSFSFTTPKGRSGWSPTCWSGFTASPTRRRCWRYPLCAGSP
jgi:hypothetical protein